MNKKTKIQLAIILVCFGAAAFVLYKGFSGGSESTGLALSSTPGGPALTPQSILPYGSSDSSLDFSVLNSRNFVFDQLQYAQLNPSSDVGVSPESLISGGMPGQ